MSKYFMRHCKRCDVWHNMSERRASRWVVNEECRYCVQSFRQATRPVEYLRPQREIRAEITRGKRLEQDGLRQEVLEVKRQVREERRLARQPSQDFRRCAKEHGLDEDLMWGLYQAHDKCCDICGTHESEIPESRLYMDHCHDTGEFRGFLCNSCNRGIGFLGDTAEAVKRAYDYLSS